MGVYEARGTNEDIYKFPLDNTTLKGGGIKVNSNDRSDLHLLDMSVLYGCICQRRTWIYNSQSTLSTEGAHNKIKASNNL